MVDSMVAWMWGHGIVDDGRRARNERRAYWHVLVRRAVIRRHETVSPRRAVVESTI
jgi:hypothetical protein